MSGRRWIDRVTRTSDDAGLQLSGGASRRSRRADGLILGCSCLLLGAFLLANLSRMLQGDEIQYLLMTHSLVVDGDLDLRDNYLEKDYLAFYPPGTSVAAEYFPSGGDDERDRYVAGLRAGRQGEWYSIHDIGLPLMLVPGYVAGGSGGALASLFAIALLLSWNVWLLGWEISRDERLAAIGWAAVMGTAPVLLYTFQLFPEPIAALLLVYAVRKVRRISTLGRWATITTALALAGLPWLHMRYAIFTMIAAAVCLLRTRDRVKLSWLAGPLAVSAILNLVYYDRVFGQAIVRTDFHEGFRLRADGLLGLAGLLVDGHAGLLIYSPIYLLGLAGLPFLWRRDPQAILTVALLGSTYLTAGLYANWSGGWCPQPARYLTPVLPLLGVPIALVYGRSRAGARWVCRALWAASLALPVLYLVKPQWAYTGLLAAAAEKRLGMDVEFLLPILAPKVRLAGRDLLFTNYWPAPLWLAAAAAAVYLLYRHTHRAAADAPDRATPHAVPGPLT